MSTIIGYLRNLSFFFILYVLFALIVFVISKTITIKYEPKGFKLKFYGVLLGLDNKDVLSFSLLIVNYLFIIYLLYNSSSLTVFYKDVNFYIIVLTNVIYALINKRFLYIPVTTVYGILMYLSIFIKKGILDYINTIDNSWYMYVVLVLMILFILVFITYVFLKNLAYFVKRNKFILKKEKGDLNG